MEATVEKMEAQLKRCSSKIDNLAAKIQINGGQARFEAVMYIDELKVLHAIAQSKCDKFKAAGDAERARLKAEMKSAWSELDAAFKNPLPQTLAVRARARVGLPTSPVLESKRVENLDQG